MTLRRALASAALSTVFPVAVVGCSNSDSDSGPEPTTEVGEAVSVAATTEATATTEAPATSTPPATTADPVTPPASTEPTATSTATVTDGGGGNG